MNDNIVGKIYILTNPSFPDYVKIGYSKNVEERINKLNADLRSIDTINDKVRVREFYLISPEAAYELLEDIAIISGTKERLHYLYLLHIFLKFHLL